MNTQENIPWEKLAQYFAGELMGEEYRKMENWIKADPTREEQIEQLYEIWKESGTFPYRLNADEAWSRLASSMDKMELDKSRLKEKATGTGHGHMYRLPGSLKTRRAGVRLRRVAMLAATVLIILTAGFFTLHYQSGLENGIAETENRVIATRQGERASYMLSDGSRVVLHAGSRLEIPEDYNSENRELYLEGEAYFETAHNPDKPFIVHSQYAYTRVVGTRFIVQAWPDDANNTEVVVSEGNVLFGDRRTTETDGELKEILLSENQRGVLGGDNGPVVADVADMDWYLGWTEGRLVFENRELRDVLPRLERWYDIEIEVTEEAIAAKKITAEIDYSLPMSDVLHGVALSLDLQVERSGARRYTFWQER